MKRLVTAGMGGGEGVFGNALGLSSNRTQNREDGGIAERHSQGERGSDSDEKRENDNQRIHVRPTFPVPMMREPATPDVPPRTPPSRSRVSGKASHDRLSESLLIVIAPRNWGTIFSFPRSKWSATALVRKKDRS